MALDISTQTIEIEMIPGTKTAQTLTRAEALVTGAGRESVETLLTDAVVTITSAEAQEGRVIVEGTVHCQATYRQGSETTLRALTASAPLSQAFDIPGTLPGMRAAACANVEHVEARYENGRMAFWVTTSIRAQSVSLENRDVITALSGESEIETAYSPLCSCKTAAETHATTIVRGEVNLPAALDARTTLMDRAVAAVDSAQPDLGGVRVKGKVNVEALVSSGVEGRPAAAVRYVMDFEQLASVPEWLAQDVCACARVVRIDTRVEPAGEGGDSRLVMDAEVDITVTSIGRDCVNALSDAYAISGKTLDVSAEPVSVCPDIACLSCIQTVKGALLLNENAPAPGNIISVIAHPNIGSWSTNGESAIEGVIEASVMYIPGDGGNVAVSSGEIPFSIKCPGTLNDTSLVCINVVSADAGAIMTDRIEVRCILQVETVTHALADYAVVMSVSETDDIQRSPGIIICWPSPEDDAWSVGKRYCLSQESIKALCTPSGNPESGRAIVMRI